MRHLAWPVLAGAATLAAALAAPSARAGQTTAAFLKIPVDSRALALGEGYSATAIGAGALASNPAGLSASSAKELSLHYARHLDGLALGHMGVVVPSHRHGSFGAALLTLRSGHIDARDDVGKQTGSFTAEDRAIALSWASEFLPNSDYPSGALKAGLTAKSISSRLASYEAHSYAVDAGVQLPARIARLPMRLGLAARNLGPGLQFIAQSDPLPLNVAVGLCASPWRPTSIFAGLSRFIYEQRNEFSVGAEFSPLTGLFLRAGGGMSQTQGGLGRLPILAAGLGFKLSRYHLDYAIVPLGDLGMTQRMSLTFRFGGQAPASRTARLQPWTASSSEGELARARRLSNPGQGFVAGQLQAARQAAAEGSYVEALRRVSNALEIEPRNIRGWEILGSIYYLKGEKKQAERAWRKALSLNPANESLKEAMKNLLAVSEIPSYMAGGDEL